MINNRQNGRRRGRGGGGNNNGPRQGGGQGRPDNGNRIDSRARGNASQLLEKYKNLAADAQRQGDRINTEYYLQFADHYFRVLADQRGRFEDQQPRRQQPFDLDGDEDYGDEGEPIRAGEQDGDARQADPRGYDANGEGRQQRRRERGSEQRGEQRGNEGEARPTRQWEDRRPRRAEAEPAPVEVAGQHRADTIGEGESLEARAEAVMEADTPAPRRRGRPRREAQPDALPAVAEGNGVDADRLPPSLTLVASDGDEAPKPRRRRTARTPIEEAPAAE